MFSKLWKRFSAKKSPTSIMIVGLDNSGKTSILNKLLSPDSNSTQSIHQSGRDLSLQADKLTPMSNVNDQIEDHEQPYPSPSAVPTVANIRATMTGVLRDGQDLARDDSDIAPTIGYNYERVHYKSLTMTVLDLSGHTRYRNLWQEFYNAVDAIVFVIDSSDLIRLVVVRDEIETMIGHPYFLSLANQAIEHVPNKPPSGDPIISAQKKIIVKQGKLIQSPIESGSDCGRINGDQQQGNRRTERSFARQRTKVPVLFLANKSDLANSLDTEVIIKALNLNKLPLYRHPWYIQATSVKLNQGISEGFDWLISQLANND